MSPTGNLALEHDADLARRARTLVGSPDFEKLAHRAGVPGRELMRRALAWQYGGPDGVKMLRDPWQPERDTLSEGRRALGTAVRAAGNRLTDGDRQLRLGTDARWYPFQRRAGSWDPAGPADLDPTEAVASLGPRNQQGQQT